MELDYGPLASEDERRALRRLLHRAFVGGDTEESIAEWTELPGGERRRALEGGRLVGGLIRVPMGQWFGARSVRTMGYAGVAVDPAARGRGIARELMVRTLGEARADGFPLATLYASTFGLYRSVGFERAGSHWWARMRLADVGVRDHELDVRAVGAKDGKTVEALVTAWAQRHDGHLDRGPYIWRRIERPRGVPAVHAWLVSDGDEPVGYARWHQRKTEKAAYDIVVLDCAALDGRAVRRLLTLFADHSTVGGELVWSSAPTDPLLLALPDRFFSLELGDQWMLRVLEVPAALEARGWPAAFSGEVHLDVEDELFPENGGRWLATIADGRAGVTRGGEGRLRLSVRGLAALYSGFLSPDALANLGWLSGSARDRASAATAFAGPPPWCPDPF